MDEDEKETKEAIEQFEGGEKDNDHDDFPKKGEAVSTAYLIQKGISSHQQPKQDEEAMPSTPGIAPTNTQREVFWWEILYEKVDPKTWITGIILSGIIAGWLFQNLLGLSDIPSWLIGWGGIVMGFWFRDKARR